MKTIAAANEHNTCNFNVLIGTLPFSKELLTWQAYFITKSSNRASWQGVIFRKFVSWQGVIFQKNDS